MVENFLGHLPPPNAPYLMRKSTGPQFTLSIFKRWGDTELLCFSLDKSVLLAGGIFEIAMAVPPWMGQRQPQATARCCFALAFPTDGFLIVIFSHGGL